MQMITIHSIGKRTYREAHYDFSADTAAVLEFLYNHKNILYTCDEIAEALDMPQHVAKDSLSTLFIATLISRHGFSTNYQYYYNSSETMNFK